jgi:hypothetical protein
MRTTETRVILLSIRLPRRFHAQQWHHLWHEQIRRASKWAGECLLHTWHTCGVDVDDSRPCLNGYAYLRLAGLHELHLREAKSTPGVRSRRHARYPGIGVIGVRHQDVRFVRIDRYARIVFDDKGVEQRGEGMMVSRACRARDFYAAAAWQSSDANFEGSFSARCCLVVAIVVVRNSHVAEVLEPRDDNEKRGTRVENVRQEFTVEGKWHWRGALRLHAAHVSAVDTCAQNGRTLVGPVCDSDDSEK